MSLSPAIALNVFLCLSLLTGLARVMALASRLTPHVQAEQVASGSHAPVAEVLPGFAMSTAVVRDVAEIATAA